MSSDLYVFENPVFSDSPTDPFHDIFQEIEENCKNSLNLGQERNPINESNSSNQISSTQFQNLSSDYGNPILGEIHDGTFESALKLMQRSHSSNASENNPNSLFGIQSQFLQNEMLNSPESSFSSCQMRRVCSTGDLQMKPKMQTRTMLSCSNPLSAAKSLIEVANAKAWRYSPEERKERIDRYRAKRTQRNFNKTIKTLADNRQRIRGRFARNDETRETSKASMCYRYEEEDNLWVERFYEDGRSTQRQSFFDTSQPHWYQNNYY